MLLIGLLIQNMGRTQKPVKMYQRTVPSHESTPESEGLLMKPAHTHTRMHRK